VTVFTSADSKTLLRRALKYLFVSTFLVAFNLIYGLFSHGIGSDYMRYAFLFPLIGGSLASLILVFLPPPGDIVSNLWRMGLSVLVVGSLLHGIFDIYGSEVAYVTVFFIAGALLLVGALTLYIVKAIQAKR